MEQKNNATEPCPSCKGQGVKVTRGNHSSVFSERKCYRCNGEQTIPSLVGQELSLKVTTKEGVVWRFNAMLHKAYAPEDLQLQQKEFYRQWRTDKSIPLFPHFEIQLLFVDSLLQYAKREYQGDVQTIPLHIHYADNQKPFMCWVENLSTQDDAIKMWKIWCLGCVWSLQKFNAGEEKTDFAYLMQELKWDNDTFSERMTQEGIKITETSYK